MSLSLGLKLSKVSRSTAGNYTTVKYVLTYSKSSTTYNNNGVSYYVNVAGSRVKTSTFKFTKGTTSGTIASGTTNISHNSDGSHAAISAYAYVGPTGFSPSSASVTSNSLSLPTIPRATQPTLSSSSVELGSAVTISMPRALSSFDHTLTYSIGSASGTIGSDLGASKSWTPPLSLANQITSATSGTVVITCKTYNGSTLIGTKTVNLTVTVPSSVVPSLSIAVTDAAGLLDTFGYYFVNYSQYKVTMTESTMYGATIKSRSTKMNGETLTAKDPTSSVIAAVANNSVQSTITDSRGRTATDSISGLATRVYTAPAITDDISIVRCDSDGTENDSGDYCKITATWTFDAIADSGTAKNTCTGKLYYRERTEDDYTDAKSVTITSGTAVIVPALHTVSNYIKITVSDDFSTAVGKTPATAVEQMISTPAKEFSLKYGYQAAIGKSAEYGTADEPVFEVAWHTKLKSLENDGESTFGGDAIFTDDILIDDAELEAAWEAAFGS